jgi:predicted dinucleotide-utilizing enzyme
MSVQMLKSLRINNIESVRFLSSSYPACHVHTQSRQGTFGGSRAKDITAIPVSMELSSPIRLLSSTSTPLVKMMMDAIEMQKNKTQRLLDLDALSSSD